jgi:site-specific DNA-methyltransferase (adenine-specific)
MKTVEEIKYPIYYKDENSTLFCGDSAIVLKQFPDNCIDLACTSPPYDQLRKYKGFTFDFETIAKELYRVTKDGGVVVWVVNDATIDGSETGTSFRQALGFMGIGFNLHDTMMWEKHTPPQNQERYEQRFEYMFVFSKGKPKTFNPLMEKKRYDDHRKVKAVHRQADGSYHVGCANPQRKDKTGGNIWYYPVGGGLVTSDEIAHEHSAIYPEQLAKDHIVSWSNEGDTVLDCFSGSGTTMKAAKLLKRNSIGIEIAKEYCELTVRRINKPMPLFNGLTS